jgi:hypothetical protein
MPASPHDPESGSATAWAHYKSGHWCQGDSTSLSLVEQEDGRLEVHDRSGARMKHPIYIPVPNLDCGKIIYTLVRWLYWD